MFNQWKLKNDEEEAEIGQRYLCLLIWKKENEEKKLLDLTDVGCLCLELRFI